jgi:hypothetical protein
MQRNWAAQQTLPSQAIFAPAQENSVTEGRSNSPVSYYEADAGNDVTSNSDSTIADFWCVTKMSSIKFNYVWTINNFSSFHEEMK